MKTKIQNKFYRLAVIKNIISSATTTRMPFESIILFKGGLIKLYINQVNVKVQLLTYRNIT